LVFVTLIPLHKIEYLTPTLDGVANAVGGENDARAQFGERFPI